MILNHTKFSFKIYHPEIVEHIFSSRKEERKRESTKQPKY